MKIQNKLYRKLSLEYDDYLESLLKSPPMQIIEAAHQIVAKKCILERFEDKNYLNGENKLTL